MEPAILIIDDSTLYCTALCSLLGTCWPDIYVGQAASSGEALTLIAQRRWDIILLDYHLPTLSGGTLVRRLRARAETHGLPFPPVVLISTQTDVVHFVRAIGAVGFLPKPVDSVELCAVLEPLLPTATIPSLAELAPLATSADDASTARLRHDILDVFHSILSRFSPPFAPGMQLQPPDHVPRLGAYLVQLGHITPRQLARVLYTTEARHPASQVPLGFTLATHNLVSPQVVTAALLLQFHDRLGAGPYTPRFIGEKLLIEGKITAAQLALALQEQFANYRGDRWVRLGDLLASHDQAEPHKRVTQLV